MDLYSESDQLHEYLRRTDSMDFDHPGIQAQAAALFFGQPATRMERLAAIRAAFDFVRDQTPHSCDIQSQAVSCCASEVLLHKEGLCYAKALLFAAFLRLWGIPCGLLYQRLFRGGKHLLHGLNAVWLASEQRWVALDARGLAAGPKAFFDPAAPRDVLVFAGDSAKGEKMFPTIYTDPLPSVMRVLRGYTTCAEMVRHLPEDIG